MDEQMVPSRLTHADPEIAARICGLAVRTQHSLEAWAARYPELSAPGIAAPIALCGAFAAPWRTADDLRAPCRLAHWLFWLDDMVENAGSRAEIDEVLEACRAVLAGAEPASWDPLTRGLFEIRDELVRRPLWNALGPRWRDLVTRTGLTYRWYYDCARADAGSGATPTPEEYLDKTFGDGVGRLTCWIAAEETDLLGHLERLLRAAVEIEPAVRLANDLRSLDRDRRDGDTNVLLLGVTPLVAQRWLNEHKARAHALLQPLVAAGVDAAVEMDRYVTFVTTFYGVTDYRAT